MALEKIHKNILSFGKFYNVSFISQSHPQIIIKFILLLTLLVSKCFVYITKSIHSWYALDFMPFLNSDLNLTFF